MRMSMPGQPNRLTYDLLFQTREIAQYEDQDEDQPEFKAAKRVESADLLAKLKVRPRTAHSFRESVLTNQQYDRAYHSGVAHRYLPTVSLQRLRTPGSH